jgi:hypothetical protein
MTDVTPAPHAPRQAKKPSRRPVRKAKAVRQSAPPKHLARYMLCHVSRETLDVVKKAE